MNQSAYCLAPIVSEAQARDIAFNAVGKREFVAAGQLHHYRLVGIHLRLHATAGPARRHDGQSLYMAVDPLTNTAMTSDPWGTAELDATDTSRPPLSEKERDQLVKLARESAFVSAIRKYRLASNIHFSTVEVVDELWKPNWIFTAGSYGILVDALNGNFAVKKRQRVPA